jgi:hypothetical protein
VLKGGPVQPSEAVAPIIARAVVDEVKGTHTLIHMMAQPFTQPVRLILENPNDSHTLLLTGGHAIQYEQSYRRAESGTESELSLVVSEQTHGSEHEQNKGRVHVEYDIGGDSSAKSWMHAFFLPQIPDPFVLLFPFYKPTGLLGREETRGGRNARSRGHRTSP